MSGLLAATAAAAEEIIRVELVEELRDRRQVSGSPVVGLTLGPAPAGGVPGRLALDLPAAPGLRLCGRIESRDGRYFARFEGPAGARPGPTIVELRRAAAAPLPRRDPPYLGILVYLAGRCADAPGGLLPVATGAPPPPRDAPRPLTLLVNSGGMTATLVVPQARGAPVRRACPSLEADDLVVFDRVCTLELGPEARLAEAYLELRRGAGVERHPLGIRGE